jgi:hypothetical protein
VTGHPNCAAALMSSCRSKAVEHWLEKADLARKFAETMSTDASKLAMFEIAELYEHWQNERGSLSSSG